MRVLPKLLVSSLFFASGSALSVVGFAQPAPDDDTPLEEPREPDPETPPDEPAPRGPEPRPPPSDPDTPPDTPDDRDATSDTPELSPPRIVSAPKATYPAGQPLMTPAPRVVLRVTIDEQGRVQQSAVLKAPGPTFATSAQQAVQAWTFEPARRNGTPIAAEVKVEVGFEAPKPATVPPGSEPARTKPAPGAIPPETPAPPSQGPLPPKAAPTPVTPPPPEPEFEATGKVEAATLRSRERGPTDFELDHELLSAAPHQDTGDMLRTVPGVYSARVEGPAVAHSIFLRGFNAEHGQDLEMRVDGVPINQPSHLHGQGYADVNFLIPEVVQELRVTEGVYDPRQGDFATAGTIDFQLGVQERGIHSKTSYGSFDTFRQLLVWAPENASVDSFGAVSYRKSDGFGQNRSGKDAAAIGQYAFGSGSMRYRITSMLYAARYQLAGVIRNDDIESGRIGFYDVYRVPTAQAQNALSARSQLSFALEQRGSDGQNSELGLWTTYHDFRLQENFTGFTQRSQINPTWVGRGDLIEQQNSQLSFGARARHRTARYRPAPRATGRVELGLSTRLDLIEQRQNLLQAPQNQTWDQRVDASITGADVGGYVDLDWSFFERWHVRGGVRADVLFYQVQDRLGNFIPEFRRDQFIVGFRRSAMGIAAGPRISSEVEILPWLSALAAYGEGYRSPQARTLDDGESAPFTKVRSADLGVHIEPNERLVFKGSGFWTHVADDVAFEAAEGRLEPIGPTTRLGLVGQLLVSPRPWALASLSATAVRATLDEPPPATAEEPSPPFEEGATLPFVAPLTLRGDFSASPSLGRIGTRTLKGKAALGVSYLSPRPLPFGAHADPYITLDASLGARLQELELTLEVINVLDTQNAANELSFVSAWDATATPSRVPARHTVAATPRAFLASLAVHL